MLLRFTAPFQYEQDCFTTLVFEADELGCEIEDEIGLAAIEAGAAEELEEGDE